MARHPKGETFTSYRDPRSGELLLRCRFCDESVEPKLWWSHKCKTAAPGEGKDSA